MELHRHKSRASTMAQPTLAHTKRIAAIALNDGGLAIDPTKLDFFAQRLGGLLRTSETSDYDEYLAVLENGNMVSERRKLMEALATHTTDFFREPQHYQFLARQGFANLEDLGAGRARAMRLWSAACSNGAELYSTLMCAYEHMALTGSTLRVEGFGTDLSKQILKRAAHAIYTDAEISGLNEERRKRHLLRDKTGRPRFRIEPKLRRLCQWAPVNLTETSPRLPRQVDVAFVRNVLIYFDRETQNRVIRNVTNALSEGGYLFTGHSEALSAPPACLQQVAPATYRKRVD